APEGIRGAVLDQRPVARRQQRPAERRDQELPTIQPKHHVGFHVLPIGAKLDAATVFTTRTTAALSLSRGRRRENPKRILLADRLADVKAMLPSRKLNHLGGGRMSQPTHREHQPRSQREHRKRSAPTEEVKSVR